METLQKGLDGKGMKRGSRRGEGEKGRKGEGGVLAGCFTTWDRREDFSHGDSQGNINHIIILLIIISPRD